jgi:hypothetical protein
MKILDLLAFTPLTVGKYIYDLNEDFRPLGFYSPHNERLCMRFIVQFILFFIISIICCNHLFLASTKP